VEVEVTLHEATGPEVARARVRAVVPPLEETVAKLSLLVRSPRLWSVDEPTLYQVRTVVQAEGVAVDEVTTMCGFRTVRFDAEHGFFLNDQPLKLQGVCNHQDHAGVGVAMPDALWEFRLRKLKEMGVNAYRCAHNPPAAELLDLFDRHGILVMDETRHFNSSPEYMRQLEWLVRRDRNHPCVMLWSVFNEEPMQGTEIGYEMVRRMYAAVKRLDSTRPITAAMNGGLFSPINVSQAVDVVGFNYQIEFYDRFHEANPQVPLTSSEDTSAFMTRGEYGNDLENNIREAYDTQFAPWGASHRDGWQAIAERPYLAGGFVWTGFDYHGEPTPHQWPSTSSFFGCLDLCGFPKTAFYLHQAHWVKDQPVLHLVPHWNWSGREGQRINVIAITNATDVELFLNGQSLGWQKVDPHQVASWEVPYAAGRLEAVAKNNGQEIQRTFVETTGAPVALRLVLDRPSLAGDGCDAQPITVQALDAAGRLHPTANGPVTLALDGPGSIIGLGNGDPNCHEPEKGNRRSLFNGLAQVIVQSQAGASGPLVLHARADGMASAEVSLVVVATDSRPMVPPTEPVLYLQAWRMSPVSTDRLDPNVEVADNDMNTWAAIQPGELQSFTEGCWALYRIKFQPFAAIQERGGRIVFRSLSGRAEVWVDGERLAQKAEVGEGWLRVELSPKVGERILTVLIETRPGVSAGLSGAISVEGFPVSG
jgi:beta-galactosidase